MNNKMMTGLVLAAFGLAANNAVAATEIYFAQEATLPCTTPAVCDDYSAMHPISVVANGSQRLLTWNNNEPVGTNLDIYTANTLAGTCSDGTRVTAVWELYDGGKPYKATVTHCDGTTKSEYAITVNHETYRDIIIDDYIDEGQCINPQAGSNWDEHCTPRT
ncbi:MAG: hypothetical protein MJK04_03485 [Psychrosphaera sp.]|nr:hypothetical protein [Psychrosphaera sp.]